MDGFRFDTGPSLLTMPFVIDELFDFLEKNRKQHLVFQADRPKLWFPTRNADEVRDYEDEGTALYYPSGGVEKRSEIGKGRTLEKRLVLQGPD